MANQKQILGFILTTLVVVATALGFGLWVSQRFGFTRVTSVYVVFAVEIVIIGIANRLFLDDTAGEADKEIKEWEKDVLIKATRIAHWDSNSVGNPEGRETIQNEVTTACSDLEDLLSEPPTDLSEDTFQLVRRTIKAGEGFEEIQTRTKCGQVDMATSDPDVPTEHMSEDEVANQFIREGSEVVGNAIKLEKHLESR